MVDPKNDMVFCVRILTSFSWCLALQCFVFPYVIGTLAKIMIVAIYVALCVILLVMYMVGNEFIMTISVAVPVIVGIVIGLHFVSHRYYKKP
jgi:hypothetical protein